MRGPFTFWLATVEEGEARVILLVANWQKVAKDATKSYTQDLLRTWRQLLKIKANINVVVSVQLAVLSGCNTFNV